MEFDRYKFYNKVHMLTCIFFPQIYWYDSDKTTENVPRFFPSQQIQPPPAPLNPWDLSLSLAHTLCPCHLWDTKVKETRDEWEASLPHAFVPAV